MLQQELEQRAGHEGRLDPDRTVQERGLLDHTDGLGLAELGHREHLDVVGLGEEVDCPEQRHLARADVRAEADVRDCHARVRSTTTAA